MRIKEFPVTTEITVCNPGRDPKHETLFTINCNDCCSILYLLPAGSGLCFISYVFFKRNY